MSLNGTTADPRVIDRWPDGVGWLAYPDETMQRASHAIAGGEGVWLLDPVDGPGVDELVADLGDVAGVVVCLDRHTRDAAAIARRHDVPVYLPDRMTGVADELDATVDRFGAELADTGFRAVTVRNSSVPPWQEVALTDGRTLYVSEAVGTAPYFLAPGERLGVHPMLRLFPPRRALGSFYPERIVVGHGEGVFDGASASLAAALDGARRRAPAAYVGALRAMLG